MNDPSVVEFAGKHVLMAEASIEVKMKGCHINLGNDFKPFELQGAFFLQELMDTLDSQRLFLGPSVLHTCDT